MSESLNDETMESLIFDKNLCLRNADGCTWIIILNSLFARKKIDLPVGKVDVTRDDIQQRFAMQMKLHEIWLIWPPVALRIVFENLSVLHQLKSQILQTKICGRIQ